MNPLKLLEVAQSVANLSKDPSTKVGAIVIDDDCNILTVGFNGFPRGVKDSKWRYAERQIKLKFIAHAEANAIAQAARVGAKLLGSTLIVTALYPCSNCAKLIIQAGIKKVYAPVMNSEITNVMWLEEARITTQMFEEAGIEINEYDPCNSLS